MSRRIFADVGSNLNSGVLIRSSTWRPWSLIQASLSDLTEEVLTAVLKSIIDQEQAREANVFITHGNSENDA
jgi:hypothetical protein